jgi:hypothetical protein
MTNNYDIKQLVGSYENFDTYLASGRFESLPPEKMIQVYYYFEKLGKLEAGERRKELTIDRRKTLDGEPFEDREIIQPDGSRACVNWELDKSGFQLVAD